LKNQRSNPAIEVTNLEKTITMAAPDDEVEAAIEGVRVSLSFRVCSYFWYRVCGFWVLGGGFWFSLWWFLVFVLV